MIDKSSKFELLGHGSQAVVSLCMWLNALVDYHHAKMAVQPFREQLAEAEKTLMDVSNTYITNCISLSIVYKTYAPPFLLSSLFIIAVLLYKCMNSH